MSKIDELDIKPGMYVADWKGNIYSVSSIVSTRAPSNYETTKLTIIPDIVKLKPEYKSNGRRTRSRITKDIRTTGLYIVTEDYLKKLISDFTYRMGNYKMLAQYNKQAQGIA